jgi:nitrogen fixation protein NifU and related proteins
MIQETIMASEADKIAEELEKEVWAGYTEAVRDHAQNPRNAGSIPHADGFAVVTGPCGDTMKIWLRVKEEVIQEAAFWTDGCGPSIASGSMVTELAKGKPSGRP